MGGAGRGGSGGSGGFQRLRRAVSAGGAALPTGDAQPRAGPPWRSSAPVTSVGLPGGCSALPKGPHPEGSTRIAFPGDALLPPEMMLAPLPVGLLSPPTGAGLGGLCPFCLPLGMLCSPPPRPGDAPHCSPGGAAVGMLSPAVPRRMLCLPRKGLTRSGEGFVSHPVTPWRGCLSQGVLRSPNFPWVESGLGGVSFSPRAGLERLLLCPFTRRPSI